ncbi:L-type lectin-domain containing receptor kinase IV.2-like protein [Carex littledalei]|uniref:L-type lectin-domain containing receptor kinase IV.2-like protein n=1 Tax=Carex littledalei TaxID=544730 RepID=A0A833QKI3_9POAL|nr:L-type lectin-domain containing receptor kinase IV.2-like protein [Carex littledalei]
MFNQTMVSQATVFQFVLFTSYFSLHCCGENFIFNGFKQASNLLSLDDAAKITKGGLLQLTNDTIPMLGHAFFSSPIPMIKTNNNMPCVNGLPTGRKVN